MYALPPSWYATLEKILRHDEGVRYLPYDCGTGKNVKAAVGKLTIGVGHNLEDVAISEAVVSLLLKEDINAALKDTLELFGDVFFSKISAPRQHAIVSMVFQLGAAGLKKFNLTLKHIRLGNWESAGKEARKSLWVKQTPKRAERVLKMLVGEVYDYKF